MKKVLTVLVSACLVFSCCFSSFAAPVKLKAADSTEVRSLYDEAMDIIAVIEFEGATTDEEILEAADNLYNEAFIEKDVYDEIYRIVENGLHIEEGLAPNEEPDSLFSRLKDILEDSSLSLTEKIAKVANILKDVPIEEAEAVLNDLKEAGVIDDETYAKISDAINGSESILGGIDTGDGSPISGIKDLISGILGMLGIGGGDSSDSDNDKTPTDSSKNPDSSKFEGSNATTGDYAIASVAGVAVVAGVALALTKIKKKDNKDNND